MAVVVIYIRFAGSEALMGEEEEAGVSRAWKWLRYQAVSIWAALAIAYLLVPIALIAVFSFNDETSYRMHKLGPANLQGKGRRKPARSACPTKGRDAAAYFPMQYKLCRERR